eukprot:CAMPEP_0182508496 /NCGR_PEP_ID=MMETSP1321-20130603/25116_1 /TAXON_ID=91990 /ORGANISM="Bolidomonas sp., Strain RCC1657" /LENGTH=122 /DNA_ID=CAMNT_0024714575 /DNA_START=398 /DNA_END=766 /DNA_ORIENTATION=+
MADARVVYLATVPPRGLGERRPGRRADLHPQWRDHLLVVEQARDLPPLRKGGSVAVEVAVPLVQVPPVPVHRVRAPVGILQLLRVLAPSGTVRHAAARAGFTAGDHILCYLLWGGVGRSLNL